MQLISMSLPNAPNDPDIPEKVDFWLKFIVYFLMAITFVVGFLLVKFDVITITQDSTVDFLIVFVILAIVCLVVIASLFSLARRPSNRSTYKDSK